MKIFVTGGAGFIGSSLVDELLSEGHNIIVTDNFDNYYDPELKKQNIANQIDNPNYKLYKTDICEKSELEKIFAENKIDLVIHLAACAGVRNSFKNPAKYIKTNVEGTKNILENMKNFSVKKIIFASSSSVYGNCRAEKFTETLPVENPISPYAETKITGEQIIYTYTKMYDISAVCLRFFTVYGPRQRPDLAIRKFTELIKKGEPVPVYGDGTTLRDYTYIDDIVSGICAAINYDKTPYEIINLGGNRPIALNYMIKTLEETLNKKAIIKNCPMQAGDVPRTVSDITKAQKLLNYNPKISFETGIKNFVQWYNSCC